MLEGRVFDGAVVEGTVRPHLSVSGVGECVRGGLWMGRS